MALVAKPAPFPADLDSWQARTAQILEERHLVAWSASLREREVFERDIAAYLRAMGDTEVCILHGRHIADLDSFCRQLEHARHGPRIVRGIDDRGGVVARLRRRFGAGGQALKRRYYVWHEATTLLTRDPELFGRLVDAITGVAAEAEYASDDKLLIHRGVFVGGAALDVYAEDARGQFRRWAREGHEQPLWDVVTGIRRPPVKRMKISTLMANRAGN